jgi:adenine/guanine phosphoribosyltransferase-like PRPP-binding protein
MKKRVRHVIRTDYLNKVYRVSQFTKTVERAVKVLRKFRRKHPFEAIAFTGTSGAALAYPLSYLLGVPLICVRKSTRDNHFGYKLEGCMTADNYIIVDDFIESGKTIERVKKSVEKEVIDTKCVGIYLYHPTCRCSSFKGTPIIKNDARKN